jgi:hypothetical protein
MLKVLLLSLKLTGSVWTRLSTAGLRATESGMAFTMRTKPVGTATGSTKPGSVPQADKNKLAINRQTTDVEGRIVNLLEPRGNEGATIMDIGG